MVFSPSYLRFTSTGGPFPGPCQKVINNLLTPAASQLRGVKVINLLPGIHIVNRKIEEISNIFPKIRGKGGIARKPGKEIPSENHRRFCSVVSTADGVRPQAGFFCRKVCNKHCPGRQSELRRPQAGFFCRKVCVGCVPADGGPAPPQAGFFCRKVCTPVHVMLRGRLTASSRLLLQKGLRYWRHEASDGKRPPQAGFFCRKVCYKRDAACYGMVSASSRLLLQKGLHPDGIIIRGLYSASSRLLLQKGLPTFPGKKFCGIAASSRLLLQKGLRISPVLCLYWLPRLKQASFAERSANEASRRWM